MPKSINNTLRANGNTGNPWVVVDEPPLAYLQDRNVILCTDGPCHDGDRRDGGDRDHQVPLAYSRSKCNPFYVLMSLMKSISIVFTRNHCIEDLSDFVNL